MLLLTVILIKKVIFLMKKISRTLDDIALEQIKPLRSPDSVNTPRQSGNVSRGRLFQESSKG